MYKRLMLSAIVVVLLAGCAALAATPVPSAPISSASDAGKAAEAKDLMEEAAKGMVQLLESASLHIETLDPLSSRGFDNGRHYSVPEGTFGYAIVEGPAVVWAEYKAEWSQQMVEVGNWGIVLAKGHDFSIDRSKEVYTSQSLMENDINWTLIRSWAGWIISVESNVTFLVVEPDGEVLYSAIDGR